MSFAAGAFFICIALHSYRAIIGLHWGVLVRVGGWCFIGSFGVVLFGLVLLTSACAAIWQASHVTFAPPNPYVRRGVIDHGNKRGVHLLLTDGWVDWPQSVWRAHMQAASEVVGEWGYVTEVVYWGDLDVAHWQYFMDLCAEFRLVPIVRLAGIPDPQLPGWHPPPADADGSFVGAASAYADFIVALEWPTAQPIIVVGNEPNHGDEWGGVADPAAYARWLIAVANALHERHPTALVLNAGFDTFTPHTNGRSFNGMVHLDAESFMDGMVSAEPNVFTYIDAWTSHPYPLGAFVAPPWQQTTQFDYMHGAINPAHVEPPPTIHNRGINGYEWELWKLAQYGVTDLPVFITETGWRFGVGGYPSAEQAAIYLDLAMHGNNGRYPNLPADGWLPWQADERVVAVTPFAFNGSRDKWAHTSWLEVGDDGEIFGRTPLVHAWQHP